ncbi:unnamed protein product, partial [Ectocarpus sp. 12 AP-2014]
RSRADPALSAKGYILITLGVDLRAALLLQHDEGVCRSGWTEHGDPMWTRRAECSLVGLGSIAEAPADATEGASKDEGSGGRTAR